MEESLNPNEIYKKFLSANIKFARLDGEASILEAKRKSFRAQLMVSFGGEKVNKAEMLAESDQSYIDYLDKMVSARTEANIAKAEFDAIRVWIDITRTIESTKRAEMNLR